MYAAREYINTITCEELHTFKGLKFSVVGVQRIKGVKDMISFAFIVLYILLYRYRYRYTTHAHTHYASILSCLVMSVRVACQAPLSMGFSRQEHWSR